MSRDLHRTCAPNWPRAILKSHDLEVIVALPDLRRGYYRGLRFEHAGMLVSITLQGVEYTREYPLAEGVDLELVAGPAEEFLEPIGYDEAKIGEPFLKMGVGLLVKPAQQKYEFHMPYSPVKLFAWDYSVSQDSVRFRQQVCEEGIAYDYEKTVRVDGYRHALIIEHELTNRSAVALNTSQYSHNFTNINGCNSATGHVVRFSVPVKPLEELRNDVDFNRGAFSFERLSSPFYRQLISDTVVDGVSATVTSGNGKSAVCYSQSFVPMKMALYADTHTVSPEFSVGIHVEPGETQSWSRTCSFNITL